MKQVYVIGCPIIGVMKVGVSHNIKLRVTSVGVQARRLFPGLRKLYHFGSVVPKGNARDVEAMAHELLFESGHHVVGEWFSVLPCQAMAAIEKAQNMRVVLGGYYDLKRREAHARAWGTLLLHGQLLQFGPSRSATLNVHYPQP